MTALRSARRLTVLVAVGLLLGACAATGGGDLGTVAPPAPTGGASIDIPSPEPTPQTSGSAAPEATTTVRAYFMLGSDTGNGGLAPVLRTVPKTQAVGAAAMRQLLAGPAGSELTAHPAMFTDIPSDATFLGLTISNGIATVDLSSEFAAGGTTATIAQRYGQVVFTLTQFSTVQKVQFQLDGQAAPALIPSGQRSGPVARADYADLLPAIWVDRPVWGGSLGNPGRVVGLANVFEAQFRIRILAADGSTVTDVAVMASCGTGCLGTFDVTVPYAVPAAGWGTLRVYDLSAKDGSTVDVVDYPVWLTPKA